MRTDGQIDRNDESNSRFSQFFESALKWFLRMYMKVVVVYSEVPFLYLSGWTDENGADIAR